MAKLRLVQFKVLPEVHEAWVHAAVQQKITLSAWIRSELPGSIELAAAPKVPKNLQLGQSLAAIAGIRQELKAIGNNLNQAAMVLNSHHLHTGQLPTQLDVREDLVRLSIEVDRLTRELRSMGQELIRN